MKRFATLLAILASVSTTASAQEEPVCMPSLEMEAALIDWYGETAVSRESDNTYVWASGVGGTWTILTYEPDGTSCALAQGDNWSPQLDADMLLAQLPADNG